METDLLITQKNATLIWYCYIDDVFFIWTHREERKTLILKLLTHAPNKDSVNFFEFDSQFAYSLSTDLYIKTTDTPITALFLTSSNPHHTNKLVIYRKTLQRE